MKNLLFFLLFTLSPWLQAQDYPISDHYDGKRFFNPGVKDEKGFFDFLKWQLTGDKKPWPDSVSNITYPKPVLSEAHKAIFTFINHATYLVQIKGLTVLTDPVFTERVSPVDFAGPKRVREPGLKLDGLPPVDVVLISHNHYDHLDVESLQMVDAKFHPLFLVPLGNEEYLKKKGIQNVKELDWWQELALRDAVITFTPALHWANRGLFDKNKTLWGSWYVAAPGIKFYFAGDTGHHDHFKEISKRLGSPDVAMIPIGAYEPRWFMKANHINPEEAVKAHLDLGAKTSLAMHFGTFRITDEGYDDPVIDLKKAMEKYSVPSENFRVLDFGESYSF